MLLSLTERSRCQSVSSGSTAAKRRCDPAPPLVTHQRRDEISERELRVADVAVADRQLALQLGILRVGGGEAFYNWKTRLVAFERGVGFALRYLNLADSYKDGGQIALEFGVARIGGR